MHCCTISLLSPLMHHGSLRDHFKSSAELSTSSARSEDFQSISHKWYTTAKRTCNQETEGAETMGPKYSIGALDCGMSVSNW